MLKSKGSKARLPRLDPSPTIYQLCHISSLCLCLFLYITEMTLTATSGSYCKLIHAIPGSPSERFPPLLSCW